MKICDYKRMTTTGVILQLCCIVVKPNLSLKRKFANGLTLISQNGNCRIKPSFHNMLLYYTGSRREYVACFVTGTSLKRHIWCINYIQTFLKRKFFLRQIFVQDVRLQQFLSIKMFNLLRIFLIVLRSNFTKIDKPLLNELYAF